VYFQSRDKDDIMTVTPFNLSHPKTSCCTQTSQFDITEPELLPTELYMLRVGNFARFDRDLMTFIYEFDPYFLNMHLQFRK